MKYSVILADPPWSYRVYTGKSGKAKQGRAGMRGVATRHYQTLPVDTIAQVPVADLAAIDCALLMWATMPCLPEAFDLMAAWGFTYKTTAFTWVKQNRDGSPCTGLGHYTRGNADLCLLGTRGQVRRQARNVSSVILSRRREHSRKPDEQYERIMRLFNGPYLEIFARQQWPGWDVWGNQAGKFPAQPYLMGEEAST